MKALLSASCVAITMLVAGPTLADRAVVLPTLGTEDEGAQNALQIDIARAMLDLRHELVEETELAQAMGAVEDGVVDATTEYVAVGKSTKADWVIVGTTEPAVMTDRVEIRVCLVHSGRVESVAREVEKAHARDQIREMLEVLLRPEGIGIGAMPWEQRSSAAPDPPTTQQVAADAPPPATIVAEPSPEPRPGPRKIHMDYMSERRDVWPPYSAGNPFIVGVAQGFAVAAVTPSGAAGSGASLVGLVRGGYAPTDLGLEAMLELGGNLLGPRALFFDVAARWMITPSVVFDDDDYGGSFHMGPRIYGGAFVRIGGDDTTGPDGQTFSSETTTHPMLGATIDMALQATPELGLEGSLGDLRWVPTDDGSIVLVGATLGGSLRF